MDLLQNFKTTISATSQEITKRDAHYLIQSQDFQSSVPGVLYNEQTERLRDLISIIEEEIELFEYEMTEPDDLEPV